MKRNAKITANDGNGHKIEVLIRFKSDNGLCKDEVDLIARQAARKCADVITELRYTDFGAENMKVKV